MIIDKNISKTHKLCQTYILKIKAAIRSAYVYEYIKPSIGI